MADFLNLDDIVSDVKKSVQIFGVKYDMSEVDVKTFLSLLKHAEEFKDKEPTLREQIDEIIQGIRLSFPSIPEDVIDRLTTSQLMALIKFSREFNGPEDESELLGNEGKAEAK